MPRRANFRRCIQLLVDAWIVTNFLQELLTRIEYLIQERETMAAQRKRDDEFIAVYQNERLQYQAWYKSVSRGLNDNSFVMVLIDGDGMIVN